VLKNRRLFARIHCSTSCNTDLGCESTTGNIDDILSAVNGIVCIGVTAGEGLQHFKIGFVPSIPRVHTDCVLHYFTNPILQAVAKLGWKTPTLIQAHAIREARTGKDLLARARTGSGKTGAYALAILNTLLVEKKVCNLSKYHAAPCNFCPQKLYPLPSPSYCIQKRTRSFGF
jgi:hypothetical protein